MSRRRDEEMITVSTEQFVIILPEIGDPAVCDQYDEDCPLMSNEQHLRCFYGFGEPGEEQKPCPFMD